MTLMRETPSHSSTAEVVANIVNSTHSKFAVWSLPSDNSLLKFGNSSPNFSLERDFHPRFNFLSRTHDARVSSLRVLPYFSSKKTIYIYTGRLTLCQKIILQPRFHKKTVWNPLPLQHTIPLPVIPEHDSSHNQLISSPAIILLLKDLFSTYFTMTSEKVKFITVFECVRRWLSSLWTAADSIIFWSRMPLHLRCGIAIPLAVLQFGICI